MIFANLFKFYRSQYVKFEFKATFNKKAFGNSFPFKLLSYYCQNQSKMLALKSNLTLEILKILF